MADETTSWKSPFGVEYDARHAHLDSLPGKVYREWFDALNRASRIVNGNGVAFNNHLQTFLGSPVFVSELPDNFSFEAARLLHNYLAAIAMFRDVQRGMHRRVWPDPYAPGTKDNRTKWEVEVWTPKVDELFGDLASAFLVGLRNYSLHYAVPFVSVGTDFRSVGGVGGAMAMSNNVALDRKQLLKWDRWSSKGRQYITSAASDSIDIVTPVAIYSGKVPKFFEWFWRQIENSSPDKILEYRYKSTEFAHYLQLDHVFTRFAPDGRAAVRRPLAQARLERAAFGTRGWRLISVDANGGAVVGPRDPDWPPLPPGPR